MWDIFCRILLVPYNIVMDLNNVMSPISTNKIMVLFQQLALNNQHHHWRTLIPLLYNLNLFAIKPDFAGPQMIGNFFIKLWETQLYKTVWYQLWHAPFPSNLHSGAHHHLSWGPSSFLDLLATWFRNPIVSLKKLGQFFWIKIKIGVIQTRKG